MSDRRELLRDAAEATHDRLVASYREHLAGLTPREASAVDPLDCYAEGVEHGLQTAIAYLLRGDPPWSASTPENEARVLRSAADSLRSIGRGCAMEYAAWLDGRADSIAGVASRGVPSGLDTAPAPGVDEDAPAPTQSVPLGIAPTQWLPGEGVTIGVDSFTVGELIESGQLVAVNLADGKLARALPNQGRPS